MKLLDRTAAAAVLVVFALSLMASPAAAHTGFESSDPQDGSTVGTEVDEIVLTFTGPAAPAGEGFLVLDSSGAERSPDKATPDAEQLVWTLSFDPALVSGPVGVRWTVQAPDAHPIQGSFSFTIDVPPPPEDAVAPKDVASEEVAPQKGAEDTELLEEGSTSSAAGQTLESFLAEAEAEVPYTDGLGAFGRSLGFVGTMLGIGGLAFVARVLRWQRRDSVAVLRLIRYAALLLLVGTAIDVVAQLAVATGAWSNISNVDVVQSSLSSSYGIAVGLRLLGALLVFAGLRKVVSTTGQSRVLTPPRTLAAVGVLSLLLSFAFDGHTASEGNRWITGAVAMAHVAAASVWAGGVLSLAVVLWHRHRQSMRLNALELAVRFSTIAGASLAIAGVAGTVLTVIILDRASALWTTPWGLLLLAKVGVVAAAAASGAFNHFVVIPQMERSSDDDSRSLLLRNTVTGEAILLGVVLIVTAVLVGAASI